MTANTKYCWCSIIQSDKSHFQGLILWVRMCIEEMQQVKIQGAAMSINVQQKWLLKCIFKTCLELCKWTSSQELHIPNILK